MSGAETNGRGEMAPVLLREMAPVLLRAAAQVEQLVIAARGAAEAIWGEAERLGDPGFAAKPHGQELIVRDLNRLVSQRVEALRVDAENLSRILKRAAVQLNRLESDAANAAPTRNRKLSP